MIIHISAFYTVICWEAIVTWVTEDDLSMRHLNIFGQNGLWTLQSEWWRGCLQGCHRTTWHWKGLSWNRVCLVHPVAFNSDGTYCFTAYVCLCVCGCMPHPVSWNRKRGKLWAEMSANWATLSPSCLSEKHIMMVLLPEQSESHQKGIALASNRTVCVLNIFVFFFL